MPVSTFKNKINPKQTAYSFTESEVDRLTDILKELAQDIENGLGISFNKALAAIARKKV